MVWPGGRPVADSGAHWYDQVVAQWANDAQEVERQLVLPGGRPVADRRGHWYDTVDVQWPNACQNARMPPDVQDLHLDEHEIRCRLWCIVKRLHLLQLNFTLLSVFRDTNALKLHKHWRRHFAFCFSFCKIPFIERSNCVPEYCKSAKDVFYTPELYRIEIQLQGLALTWPSWRLDWIIIRSTSNIGVSYGTILTLPFFAQKKKEELPIDATTPRNAKDKIAHHSA